MNWRLSVKKLPGISLRFLVGFIVICAFNGFALSQEIEVNTLTVSVPEGGSTTNELQVRLTADPGGTVTVSAANISGDVDITTAFTFDFDSGNYGTYQNVVLLAAEDDDAANGSATIRLSGTGLTDVDVTANEADNDTLALDVLGDPISVPEGTSTTTELRVRLTAAPVGTLIVSAANISGDADITTTFSFGFTAANYNNYQNVVLTAAEDADTVNGSATIRLSGTGVNNVDVTANEVDNDTLALDVLGGPVSVPEGTSTTTELRVRLTAAPVGTLIVSAANISGDADITTTFSFGFTAANYNTYQNVVLTAAEDADAANGSTTIRLSGSGVSNVDVMANEVDNDTLALDVLGDPVSVPEGTSTTTELRVRLTAAPVGTLTVSAANISGDADITTTFSFGFTAANYNTYQNVILSAAEDDDAVNGSATIRLSGTGLTNVDVTATETENDTLEFATSSDTVDVPEGSTATFDVWLTAQPQSDVSVSVQRVSGDSSIIVQSGNSLTFTTTNWADHQTVTLFASQDPDIVNGNATVRISDNGSIIDDYNINAVEIDDDTLNFVTNVSEISVPEDSTNTFEVTLNFQPTGNVNATVSRPSGDADITVQSGTSLTFTQLNWDQPHIVILAAAEDDDSTNGTATIRISDNAAQIGDRNVTATETDNDSLNFETSVDSLSIPEGDSGTFQVKLTADPLGVVSVTVDNVWGDADIQPDPDPTILSFNSNNWGDFQLVTIDVPQDADTTNGSATIRISAVSIPDKDITVDEVDDDSLSFQTRYTPVSVPEGGTADFEVRLSAQPSSNVNVTVSRASGDTDITVQSGSNLVFTRVNWHDYQPVTLAAAEDSDTTNGQATIRLTASGIPTRNVTATEQDNDTSNGAVSLVLDPSEATSGQAFTVAVQIANNNDPLSSFGFGFVFDGNVFSFEGIQVGSLTSDWGITSQTINQNRVRIEGSGGTVIPDSSNGTLVTLLMRVKCVTFDSEVERALKIENYTGDMSDAFSPEPCSADFTYLPCSVLGDVNGDGNVTPGDAQVAFEIFLGVQAPDMCQQMTADANCSGGITPGDAQDIFEHFLGIITLPACCADAQMIQQVSLASQRSDLHPVERIRSPEARQLFPLNMTGCEGDIVSIPVLLTDPQGVSCFSLDMNYPSDMLEYLGVRKSPMTAEFDDVSGVEETPGLVHIMGNSTLPVESHRIGSLAVAVFRVKQGLPDRLPVLLFNADGDILNAEIRQGSFARINPKLSEPGWVILGRAIPRPDGTLRIPVRVSGVSSMRSFGMDFRFSESHLHFVGIEHTDDSQQFMALEGYEMEAGFVRVGGYGLNKDQGRSPGVLFQLVFISHGGRGEVELVNLWDDLRDFEFRKRNTRIE